jgi:preprotein translocase subunit SecA
LYVIGTNRHEARRIDNQLRGRAGRQGDPGETRFLLSLDDELVRRFGVAEWLRTDAPYEAMDRIQRLVEGQNLEIRKTLAKYESIIESQRRDVVAFRESILYGREESLLKQLPDERLAELSTINQGDLMDTERRLRLIVLDELWSEYLAAVAEVRSGIHWVTWGGRDPLHSFLKRVQAMFETFEERADAEPLELLATLPVVDGALLLPRAGMLERGATWTYVINDEPFGSWADRMAAGLRRKLRNALKK